MVFDYFLLDAINRDAVREANNNLVKRCDEVWVFGAVSNGVLAEVHIARQMKKPVRYFSVDTSQTIIECSKDEVTLEDEVADMRHLL